MTRHSPKRRSTKNGRRSMTLAEVNRSFREDVLPTLRHTDPVALRTAWNDYTDSLHRDGRITDYARNNWVSPKFKRASGRKSERNGRAPSKWIDLFVVQGNYGYGWEDVSAADTYKEARADLKSYRENSPGSHRLITRKVLRSNPNIAYRRPSR